MKAIYGKTYPHRVALAKMGGKFNAADKAWEVPDDRAEEARAIVAGREYAKPEIPLEECITELRRLTEDSVTSGPQAEKIIAAGDDTAIREHLSLVTRWAKMEDERSRRDSISRGLREDGRL